METLDIAYREVIYFIFKNRTRKKIQIIDAKNSIAKLQEIVKILL